MSLYHVQKFLFRLNRDEAVQAAYTADPDAALAGHDLTDEERRAITEPDIGLLYHLGVNGQILMHFAAFHQVEWQDYLQRMRDGIAAHGPVREGVYAMTTTLDEVVAPVHGAPGRTTPAQANPGHAGPARTTPSNDEED